MTGAATGNSWRKQEQNLHSSLGGRDAAVEEPDEAAQGAADDEAHGGPEGTALGHRRHVHLLLWLYPRRP